MSRLKRRTIVKQGGAVVLGLSLTTTTAAAQEKQKNDHRVARLRGSYESPVSLEDARNKLRQLTKEIASADRSVLADWAVPEFDPDSEMVEYVARIDPSGTLSQYYGAADTESVDDAHTKADNKETEFRETVATQDTNTGPDWNYIKDNQASTSKHFGEIINTFEWHRERDDGQERNAFRSKMACSDDTHMPYNRSLYADHDWSVSELGGEEIHEADPGTTDDSPVDVSIGAPPSLELSWSFGGSGSITHSLDTNPPHANWTRDLPDNGTVWFHPGSHVVSDRGIRGDKQELVKLKATGEWGLNVYKTWHSWTIHTST